MKLRAVIRIDDGLCIRPPGCNKCLVHCPLYVFQTYPLNQWKVSPQWTNLCVGCGLCVELCPTQAIEVIYDSVKIIGSQFSRSQV